LNVRLEGRPYLRSMQVIALPKFPKLLFQKIDPFQITYIYMILDNMLQSHYQEVPINKWAGVNASPPFGSSDLGAMGLEFNIASTSVNIVVSSSKVRFASAIFFDNNVLADFTEAYHRPPKCGARGGIKQN